MSLNKILFKKQLTITFRLPLCSDLKDNFQLIQDALKGIQIVKIHEIAFVQKSEVLSVSEIALLAFGCIIFVSAVIGFVAVCRRQR